MNNPYASLLLSQHYYPDAYAKIKGGTSYPDIFGNANFYHNPAAKGIIIEVEVSALPGPPVDCPHFLGLHIHENGNCSNNFADTGMHYNPQGKEHPCHAGDLPSLLNNNGYAYLCFYDSFLSIEDVMGRSIIIHDNRDDFTSQPAGDSGAKIACGVIKAFQ